METIVEWHEVDISTVSDEIDTFRIHGHEQPTKQEFFEGIMQCEPQIDQGALASILYTQEPAYNLDINNCICPPPAV